MDVGEGIEVARNLVPRLARRAVVNVAVPRQPPSVALRHPDEALALGHVHLHLQLDIFLHVAPHVGLRGTSLCDLSRLRVVGLTARDVVVVAAFCIAVVRCSLARRRCLRLFIALDDGLVVNLDGLLHPLVDGVVRGPQALRVILGELALGPEAVELLRCQGCDEDRRHLRPHVIGPPQRSSAVPLGVAGSRDALRAALPLGRCADHCCQPCHNEQHAHPVRALHPAITDSYVKGMSGSADACGGSQDAHSNTRNSKRQHCARARANAEPDRAIDDVRSKHEAIQSVEAGRTSGCGAVRSVAWSLVPCLQLTQNTLAPLPGGLARGRRTRRVRHANARPNSHAPSGTIRAFWSRPLARNRELKLAVVRASLRSQRRRKRGSKRCSSAPAAVTTPIHGMSSDSGRPHEAEEHLRGGVFEARAGSRAGQRRGRKRRETVRRCARKRLNSP